MQATPAHTWLALVGNHTPPLREWLSGWHTPVSGGQAPLMHVMLVVATTNAAANWQAWQAFTQSVGDAPQGTPGLKPTNATGNASATDTLCTPGVHRFQGERWTLTLCVVQSPLAELPSQLLALQCHAHRVWLSPELQHLSALPKALARLCALGAQLTLPIAPDTDAALWQQAGFVGGDPAAATWAYQPRWPVPAAAVHARPQAIVIGAGLAGAAACASLTRRGWQVDLLDGHDGPAQGASALPVGLMSEHVTANPTVMSELSVLGMALHLRELLTLVPPGDGWQPTQVSHLADPSGPSENDPGTAGGEREHRANGDDTPAPPPPAQGASPPGATLTLSAAMIRPSALVQAWLAQAQATGLLRTQWSCPVAHLQAPESSPSAQENPTHPGDWLALNAAGEVLARAPHVVVAAAFDSAALLAPHMAGMDCAPPLRPVKGQMTFAPLSGEPLAPHALRAHGVYVPCYEDRQHPSAQRLWTMGSTYERGINDRATTAQALERNASSLQALWPAAHSRLRQQQADGELRHWAEVRCATLDRLPLVGAVPRLGPIPASASLAAVPRVPGLWAVCGMGSRGLTLAKLAAELLVARMLSEPLPMEKRHADALDPARFALKAARSRPRQAVATR